jgi:hypothetical protein
MIWDWKLYFPSEGSHATEFPGLNPRILGPMASMLTTRPLRVTHSEDTQHAGWPAIPEPLCRTYSVPDACALAVNDTTRSSGWGKPCDGTAHPSTYSKRCTRSYHVRSPRPLQGARLALLHTDSSTFLNPIITMHETWVWAYKPNWNSSQMNGAIQNLI